MDNAQPVMTETGKKPVGLVYGKAAKFWKVKQSKALNVTVTLIVISNHM